MVFVPRFAIGGTPVTNAEFLAFVEDGGYRTREWWASEDWRWRVRAELNHPIVWMPRGAGGWCYRALFDLGGIRLVPVR